jgi:hypothetical protein
MYALGPVQPELAWRSSARSGTGKHMIDLPISVNENGDVTQYWSVAEVESKLEAIDVEIDEYVVTDAKNRLLKLSIEYEVRRSFFGLFSNTLKVVRVSE